MNKLGLNKISSERKGERIVDRFEQLLNRHKNIKKTKVDNIKIFKQKFCFDHDLFSETTS